MSSREWWLRVQDILDAIARIQRYMAGQTLPDLQQNEMVAQALLYNFVIIGEAARNIPLEIQQRHPEIAWRDVISTRNIFNWNWKFSRTRFKKIYPFWHYSYRIC